MKTLAHVLRTIANRIDPPTPHRTTNVHFYADTTALANTIAKELNRRQARNG